MKREIALLFLDGRNFSNLSKTVIRLMHLMILNYILLDNISEKAMAPHSSTLAWKIPWTEEPGGLLSMRSQRVGHD